MNTQKSRRRFLAELAGGLAVGAAASTSVANGSSSPSRPNIVLIVADDLGYGDLGCYGCPDIRTSAVDSLAADGVRFTSFYANGPECSPTRTALLTGRYQQRVGGLECAIGVGNVGRYDDAIRLRETHDLGLPVTENTIVRMLKDAGYVAGLFGKWHLGYEPKFSPLKHGFDYAFGPLGGNADYYYHCEHSGDHTLRLNDEPVHRDGYLTDLFTEEALGFLERHHQDRFFLYVPYTAPHSPYQRPDDKPEEPVSREDWNKGSREIYASMVERMDKGIGQILKTLDSKGVRENTLVIFMTDNGGAKYARNDPFSGHKGGLFEGGIRVPCIVRWPGRIVPGTVSEQVCISMDLTASIARIVGVSAPKNRPFDGIDILREVEKGKSPYPRTLFWRARRGDRTWRAVRDGTLKYITRQDGDEFKEYLFDLDEDLEEKDNLLTEMPNEVARLRKQLAEWEAEVRPVP